MKINDLDNIAILGMGLLGGSLGMAIEKTMHQVTRTGYSRSLSSAEKAKKSGGLDIVCETVPEAVKDAQLVVLCSPLGTFEGLMEAMADHLKPGCIVTDVGSTKVLPRDLAKKILPKHVEFLGSHPMAGSEQQGVDFAMADLFEGANCILTPEKKNKVETLKFLHDFWSTLGMMVCEMTPAVHDKTVAAISHLPQVIAASLMNISKEKQMEICGKGFLDTTRIASGPEGMWRDILMSNAGNVADNIDRMINELSSVRDILRKNDDKKIYNKLGKARAKRSELLKQKLRTRELLS
ncbi:MAG: prephenate dehydrogenase/arogenate dehydrogenase family protein [Phycisphaerae bacterium]|nr:prephenate dehydrogenase/arogenate dehydrogenase family protein [Phycisphaerae bacterium]